MLTWNRWKTPFSTEVRFSFTKWPDTTDLLEYWWNKKCNPYQNVYLVSRGILVVLVSRKIAIFVSFSSSSKFSHLCQCKKDGSTRFLICKLSLPKANNSRLVEIQKVTKKIGPKNWAYLMTHHTFLAAKM